MSRFCLETALLAGRFRPAMRFATRGSSSSLGLEPVGTGTSRRTGGRVSSNPTLREEDAMTKRNEAKYKIDRRLGQNIWGRPKSPVNRREYGPGQHGQRRKG